MDKKIKNAAYDIYFDKKRGRVFTIAHSCVRVYDTKTMERIAVLRHPNPTCVYVDQTSGIVAIMSTETEFAFYSADDYTPLGSFAFKGKRNWSSSDDFYYDEKETMIYGLANKDLVEHIYCVSPKTLTYRLIPLTPQEKEGELLTGEPYIAYEVIDYPNGGFSIEPIKRISLEKPYTRHKLHRYENGSFYMIRNFYNVGSVGDRVYEALYGRFEEENGTLVLKEKLYSTKERCLAPLDIELNKDEEEPIRRFCAQFPSGVGGAFPYLKFYRSERGLFLIMVKTLYRYFNGKFEKEYESQYFSDYKEFEGRRYFGDWEFLHVQDIPKE